MQTLLELADKIPDVFALIGFTVGVVGACIAYGHNAAANDAARALVAADADHWAAEEPAAYRDAA